MIDEQEITRLARSAAHANARDDVSETGVSFIANPATIERRAKRWVLDYSHKLGIVDYRGMIDVNGETARKFEREYARIYRSLP